MRAASLHFPTAAPRDHAGSAAAGQSARAWPIALLGVPFANVSTTVAVEAIGAMVDRRRPHRVLTANIDTLLQARRDPELRQHLMEADLVLCDSRSLVTASRWLGNPLPEAVDSAELARRLVGLSERRHYRLFLIDSVPGRATEVGAALMREYPGLAIAGTVSAPPDQPLDEAKIVQWTLESRPDLIFASFGNAHHARQFELLRHSLDFAVSVQFCVGLSALFPRACPPDPVPAPHFLTREFQTWREAARRRFNRAVACSPALLRQWWRTCHRALGKSGGPAVVAASNGWVDVDVGRELTRVACDRHPDFWSLNSRPAAHYALDVSQLERIDATGLAILSRWRLALERVGRRLVLVSPSSALQAALAEAQLAPLFEVAASTTAAHERSLGRAVGLQQGIMRSLAWCGEIVASNVEDVWRMTSDYIRTFTANGATLITVDLSRLRQIDVSGAALMVQMKKFARDLRVELFFAHPEPAVLAVLQATALDALLLEGGQ